MGSENIKNILCEIKHKQIQLFEKGRKKGEKEVKKVKKVVWFLLAIRIGNNYENPTRMAKQIQMECIFSLLRNILPPLHVVDSLWKILPVVVSHEN